VIARHLQHGEAGEKLARVWLEAQGLQHVQSNFRCKMGELDLIMLDDLCLVIVEVRYRASCSHGGPLLSVTPQKRQKIFRATRLYLQQHKALSANPLRFDVLALSGPLDAPVVDWRKRAFSADDCC
jgi:putative endonuclease